MTRSVRIALRFMLVMVALLALSVVFAPSTPQRSPYLSGLSDLTAGPALAAPCGNRVCPLHPGGSCNPVDPSRMKECKKSGGTCVTVDC